MPGLIPLMLNPVAAGNRSSVVFAPSQPSKRHSRGQSLNHVPLSVHSPQSPSFTPNTPSVRSQRASLPLSPRSKTSKRLSLASPPALPALPYTPEDWKRAIAEVKRQHSNRRFRACFMRCNEILDNTKDVTNVEPAYLISLHFYAATAMEMCARPLSNPSAYRLDLFEQARIHYQLATGLSREAESLVQYKFRLRQRFSFLSLESPYSPSSSASSRTWASESRLSSPTPSVCSSEDLDVRLRQLHIPSPPGPFSFPRHSRKKVSFELPRDAPVFEPYIRPDSPTLGFDDEYFATGLARQDLPEIPACSKRLPVSSADEFTDNDDDTTPRASVNLYQLRDGSIETSPEPDYQPFEPHNPASRYCAHLANLKTRLAQHMASLETFIQTSPCSEGQVSDRNPTPIGEDMCIIERKARIERLRKSGWQRKRFNPGRYEALCNAALAELN